MCILSMFLFLSLQEHVKEEKTQKRQEAKKVQKREKGESYCLYWIMYVY